MQIVTFTAVNVPRRAQTRIHLEKQNIDFENGNSTPNMGHTCTRNRLHM